LYTQEQLARRKASPWTLVVSILAPTQFIAFVISFYLVVQFLLTNQGYLVATVSVWIKITLLWAITIAGMLWEKDVYDHYFMAREFFWEDFGNLVAMITHNAYFIVQYLGYGKQEVMYVMLFAYCTYLFNFGQFMVKYLKSVRQRYASRKAMG
jgi:3-vinyl bacteriochlorophyllide hydratase